MHVVRQQAIVHSYDVGVKCTGKACTSLSENNKGQCFHTGPCVFSSCYGCCFNCLLRLFICALCGALSSPHLHDSTCARFFTFTHRSEERRVGRGGRMPCKQNWR